MKRTLVSVILPSYNERENLMILIPKIFAVCKQMERWDVEICLVDDNSPDGTARAIQSRFGKRVRVIVRKHERGLGTAIGVGVRASRGAIIIGMDADGNHDPKYIPTLLSGVSRHDIVIGSRFILGGRREFAMSYICNMIIKHILGFPVYDNTSGFYAIQRKQLLALDIDRIYQGYGDYHLRLVWLAKEAGFSMHEVPVQYSTRRYGQSKSRLPIMLVTYWKTALHLRLGMI